MNNRAELFNLIKDIVAKVLDGADSAGKVELIVSRQSGQFATRLIPVTIEIAPARHGCGWEPPVYWAHTTSMTPGRTVDLNAARHDLDELVGVVCDFLNKKLASEDADYINVITLLSP